MNKDESIKDKEQMARIIAFELCPYKYHKEWWGENAKCYSDNNFAHCPRIKEVVDKLYNANYCKLVEGEIVVKESEYEKLCHLAYFGYEDVKQETVREILQEVYDTFAKKVENGLPNRLYDDFTSQVVKIIANRHGIELERNL